MSEKIKISCLPVGGIENPYQFLMMEGLRLDNKLIVLHGIEGKFGAILRTAIIQKPDYIHFDWIHQYYLRRKKWMTWLMMPFYFIEIVLVRRFFKVKLVWTLHNIMPHDQPMSGPYIWSRRFFAKQCDWIRVFSESTIDHASRILKIDKNKLKVVPEGSYVGYYPNKVSREEARERFGIPSNKQVFLFFGSIKPYKGIESLINIYKQLGRNRGILLIAGKALNKAYLDELTSLIGQDNQIIVNGDRVPVDVVQYYMNAADIVVLPFKKIENSGSVILSMGFSKAVIAPFEGVLPMRLSAQNELLYKEHLSEVFENMGNYNLVNIEEIGRENFINLTKYKWEDFSENFGK